MSNDFSHYFSNQRLIHFAIKIQPIFHLLAGIYFILAPFIAHAIANAYWKKEDRENNLDLQNVEVEVDENHPFFHPKEKMQALESEDSEKLKADERFSVTTLEIDEDE